MDYSYLITVALIVATILPIIRRKRRSLKLVDSSVLLSYYTDSTTLTPLISSTKDGIHYQAFTTISRDVAAPGPTLLYRFELPFRSATHLLGIPKNAGADQLRPDGKALTRVSLEGDYNSYFTLYAGKDMGSETQYVLDPSAMSFTVDFCQSHNWEIIGSDLYFAQTAGTGAADDPTDMWDDVNEFIAQIRPAVEISSDESNRPQNTLYKNDHREDLVCLECDQTLAPHPEASYFSCPAGHGILIQGAKLPQLRSSELTISLPDIATNPSPKKHLCPSCQQPLAPVAYSGSSIEIDTCSACPYRWLDPSDIANLAK